MVTAPGQSGANPLLALQSGRSSQNSIQSTIQRSIQNPAINTGNLLGTQNATSLVSTAVSNMQTFLDSQKSDNRGGTASELAGQLFGGGAGSVLSTLRSSSQARIQQSLSQPQQSQSVSDQRQQLVSRLSELSLEQLAVLNNATKENPDVDVPQGLRQSVEAMSTRDRTTFRMAVREAIDNVTRSLEQQVEQSQGSKQQGSGGLGNLINTSV